MTFIGKTFGSWTVLSKISGRLYQCVCNKCSRNYGRDIYSLTRGLSTQCASCSSKTKHLIHGLTNDPIAAAIRKVRADMLARCYNSNNAGFHNYGGRGITVCEEWVESFLSFYKWAIGSGFSDKLSIERIDNDGDYEPNNCKWATRYEQQRNKRTNRLLTHNGKTMCLTDWATEVGIDRDTLRDRLNNGWSVADVLSTPLTRKYRGSKK